MDAVNTPTAKTANITAPGYYYFDGRIWQKMGADGSAFTGDIKHSARTADHGGWYLLNGRAISTLPAAAQTAAASLGFTGNIPNAINRVLKTKTAAETVGAVGGANTITIARVNLPNVNLTGNVNGNTNATGVHTHAISGTAMSAGAHSHTVSGNAATSGAHFHAPPDGHAFLLGGTYVNNNGTGNYQGNSQPGAWGNIGARAYTGTSGAHAHTVSGSAANGGAHGHNLNADAANAGGHSHAITGTATVNTGGAGTALDNRSAFLAVNTYIYLGQ